MTVEHSWASRAAVATIGALAAVQMWWVADSGDPIVVTAAGFVGALTALACLKMARDNCFESRLVAVVVTAAQLTTAGLAATVGLPGAPGPQLHTHLALAGSLATVVLVLIALDRAARAHRDGEGLSPPYAS